MDHRLIDVATEVKTRVTCTDGLLVLQIIGEPGTVKCIKHCHIISINQDTNNKPGKEVT